MSVRAKFKVDSVERGVQISRYDKNSEGDLIYSRPIKVEQQTIKMSPVYGNGDPEHENSKFWKYTPSGSLVLSAWHVEAGNQFVVGNEYYLDFTPADRVAASPRLPARPSA